MSFTFLFALWFAQAMAIQPTNINLPCDFHDISSVIAAILCAVETKKWFIPEKSLANIHSDCILGSNRCDSILSVPHKNEIKPSSPPRQSLNLEYTKLALIAEKNVPKTWWGDGFADERLLLTRNTTLPRRQLDLKPNSNRQLRNIYHCITKPNNLRKSFHFRQEIKANIDSAPCKVMNMSFVTTFLTHWREERVTLGIELLNDRKSFHGKHTFPKVMHGFELRLAAQQVLDHFLSTFATNGNNCFKIESAFQCRGALAAAALVVSANLIADIAGYQKSFTESELVRGYILASLGRGLLHSDNSTTTRASLTVWEVRATDFTALQGAYLKLYIDTYGKEYTRQLDKHIPVAFSPNISVTSNQQWKHLANSVEPIYSSLRNWMYVESNNIIDFGPYRPLAAFSEVRRNIKSVPHRRRVLIDVGANGFFASPKYLIDSYAPYLPFTHVVMIEPEPHFSATVPTAYQKRYNITNLPTFVEVSTGSENDMLRILPRLVTAQDFVVLKFDVDPDKSATGPTMEWGFLFSLMANPEVCALFMW